MTVLDGEVKQLVLLSGDGQIGKRFNIVIVAEGYRSSDQHLFQTHAANVLERLKMNEPYHSEIDAINVFRLDVVSKMAGADNDGSGADAKATYFDATFCTSPAELLVVDEVLVEATVSSALKDTDGTPGPAHKIVVLVNTKKDGGSGGTTNGIAVSSTVVTEEFARTVLHELGHAFGLADEYPNEYTQLTDEDSQPPNLSTTYVREKLPQPWQSLVNTDLLPTVRGDNDPALDPSTIGAFPVEGVNGEYVPQWECTMQNSGDPYCVVCSQWIKSQLATFE